MLQIKVSTWQYDALCRQHSSNLFFPPATFEKKEDREKREAKAKAVCSGCPVKFECLEEANEISEPFGVWGCLLYTSPSPRDMRRSRMPSSA